MTGRWTVLASGSDGNASLLECNGQGLLLDIGLGPRQFESRLREIGFGWDGIRAVLLTHTHADHWNARSLARLVDLRVPLHCHGRHLRSLQLGCSEFQDLQFAGLVKTYSSGQFFSPVPGVRCQPLELRHDGGRTFGFRIEDETQAGLARWAIGYAADLGSWDARLPESLANVDVLAIEFNHDVPMQLASRRARWLINRNLGEFGHLSNVQGARLLEECVRRSTSRTPRHLIQLHLSRECNRPELAVSAARNLISRLQLDLQLHTAAQDEPGQTIALNFELAGHQVRQPAVAGRLFQPRFFTDW
jgi:phosphoribosyl 1,2-cyclic phosphodiesterase